MHIQAINTINLNQTIGQLRAVPVTLKGETAVLLIYASDFDVDPYKDMFFFPSDTLKMTLINPADGKVYWHKDLGPGIVPGVWFCPVFPFDLDQDGTDEIWYVSNTDADHPLSLSHYRLACLNAENGSINGQWDWPYKGGYHQNLSSSFRNFIFGGYDQGQPILINAQGTYGDMFLQAYSADMQPAWELELPVDQPGALGSHMCAVADIRNTGTDCIVWGEHIIDIRDGQELFCLDRTAYNGHSDIVQPIRNRESGDWSIYVCREGDQGVSPRILLYDAQGNRIWGHVDQGHIDMGWTAYLTETQAFSMGIRIGNKTCGPDGRFHEETDEFVFNTVDGSQAELPFSVYRTLPVDLNGDGIHELIRAIPGSDGTVLLPDGTEAGCINGPAAMLCKFMDAPGEQVLTYHANGDVCIWQDTEAHDSPIAENRYASSDYQLNKRMTATGYNLVNLGGI